MAYPTVISPEFLLWCECLPLWSIAVYGVIADPVQGEKAHFRWMRWMIGLSARALLTAALVYALSQSISLSSWLLLSVFFQPILRYRLPMRLLAEFESLWTAAFLVCSLAIIRFLGLPARWFPGSVSPAQLAALLHCGEYPVRGGSRRHVYCAWNPPKVRYLAFRKAA
jgi:hypothetical protein